MGFSDSSCYRWLLLLCLSLPISLTTVCGNAEVRVLMEMKASLDPTNRVLFSWVENRDPCAGGFVGVVCNEHRKVANISLQGKGLSGEIPPAVARLKCLSGLYLHYNSLTGKIPTEISQLTELNDLYLNVNNLSGSIPSEIGSMASLQVLQLCYNQLSGNIPMQIGSIKRLSVLALQHNGLSGAIPATLGNLRMLKRLNLSFNYLIGAIPAVLADISVLEILDVQNNNLSGFVSPALKRLGQGFHYTNNLRLCGVEYASLGECSSLYNSNEIDVPGMRGSMANKTAAMVQPEAASIHLHCNQTHCSNSSKFPQIAVVAGTITFAVTLVGIGLLTLLRCRRRKQKIGSAYDTSDGQQSTTATSDLYKKSPSTLVSLDYTNGCDPFADGQDYNGFAHEFPRNFRFNLEEVESATQYFSENNFLQRSKFSSVYKGTLRDGSHVSIWSLSATSCKSEEAEFTKGLNLLTSLRHENLVQLRGFCCSRGRGECFLIYDYAPNGSLSRYLDVQDGSHWVLDWSTRVSIIRGIAEGIAYLHSSQPSKPPLIHQNISAEKILIGQHSIPLISDSGLPKLLADDVVFSALKVSAAMGYLAPEYITTGRFTEKSDVYAFGVIVLQMLSGTQVLSTSMRAAAEACKFTEFIDVKLHGKFSEFEAAKLAKAALACTNEQPDQRPRMVDVIHDLNKSIAENT